MKASPNTAIDYQVIRSRRKTTDIIIERDGSVLVRAPQSVGDEQVAAIVSAKRYWIYQRLAEWRDLNRTRVLREYKNGEGFFYLGRSYRLLLVDDQREPLLLKNGRFALRRDLVDQADATRAKAAFRDFYVSKGRERLGQRVAYFAPKVGAPATSVDVRELGHRWASWSTRGRVAFHWKCMMAPQTVVDYIVVHELCHFHQRHHTEAFWNEVDKVMPAYRDRKDWLRRHGAALDL